MIPVGASDHPLDGLGYANFADEIKMQEQHVGLFFDTIVVATAGLIDCCMGERQRLMLITGRLKPQKD